MVTIMAGDGEVIGTTGILIILGLIITIHGMLRGGDIGEVIDLYGDGELITITRIITIGFIDIIEEDITPTITIEIIDMVDVESITIEDMLLQPLEEVQLAEDHRYIETIDLEIQLRLEEVQRITMLEEEAPLRLEEILGLDPIQTDLILKKGLLQQGDLVQQTGLAPIEKEAIRTTLIEGQTTDL